MRRVTIAAIVAAVLLAATGCLTPLTSQPPLTPVPTPASPLVGVYEPGAPGSWPQIAEFTDATGAKPGIVVYYSSWDEPFSTSFAQTAWDHDAYVLVQLEPKGVTLTSIAAGGSDTYLPSYADRRRRLRPSCDLVVRPRDERHLVLLGLRPRIAGDVRGRLAARRAGLPRCGSGQRHLAVDGQLHPGSVEFAEPVVAGRGVGRLDRYRRLLLPGHGTFGWVFGSTIAGIRTFSSAPMLIAEASVGTTANRKARSTRCSRASARNVSPGWSGSTRRSTPASPQDWHLEDDPAAIVAFTAAVATYLGG